MHFMSLMKVFDLWGIGRADFKRVTLHLGASAAVSCGPSAPSSHDLWELLSIFQLIYIPL